MTGDIITLGLASFAFLFSVIVEDWLSCTVNIWHFCKLLVVVHTAL